MNKFVVGFERWGVSIKCWNSDISLHISKNFFWNVEWDERGRERGGGNAARREREGERDERDEVFFVRKLCQKLVRVFFRTLSITGFSSRSLSFCLPLSLSHSFSISWPEQHALSHLDTYRRESSAWRSERVCVSVCVCVCMGVRVRVCMWWATSEDPEEKEEEMKTSAWAQKNVKNL